MKRTRPKENALLLLMLLLFLAAPSGQGQEVDSLEQELEKDLADTTRVEILNSLAQRSVYGDPEKAREYAERALSIARKNDNKGGMGNSHHSIGLVHYIQGEHSKCLESWKKALTLREESGAQKGAIATLGNIGIVHQEQGDYPEALENYFKALEMAKKMDDKRLIANNHGNIGVVYAKQGDYPKALEYYFNALRIAEKMEDKDLMAKNLGNIGSVYEDQGEHAKALEQYKRSLKLAEELEDRQLMANTLGNIGLVHKEEGARAKALEYYSRSLALKKEIGDKRGMANSLGNIGTLYAAAYKKRKKEGMPSSPEGSSRDSSQLLGEGERPLARRALLDSAIAFQEKAFALRKELGHRRGLTFSLNALGEIRLRQGRAQDALSHFRRSYDIADEIGSMSRRMEAAQWLYRTFKEIRIPDSSLVWHERYTAYKDSVFNEEKQKALGKQEARYEFDKQLLEQKKEQEKQAALAEERNRRQRVISYSAAGGLFMVLVFAIVVANRLRVTRRQKRLIEEQKQLVEEQKSVVEDQKQLVEEKNQEITDSINYAKRLQEAVLPPAKLLDAHLKEHFILFKPKEIVSGDFYFMDVLEEQGKERVYYAAADCTGHGVPGAMVSIVGANGLKRCIQEFGLRDPSDILEKLSELVAENFSQSEEQIRDGMDLALCCLEYENGEAARVLYAGANNPLWIINPERKEWPEELTPFKQGGGAELAPTRKAIGYTEDSVPFRSQSVELEKGDSLYSFSDGYPDQFGGEKGKKFKSANFKKLLLSLQDKSMEEQKELIDNRLEEWRGKLEQVDDICVIGVRV